MRYCGCDWPCGCTRRCSVRDHRLWLRFRSSDLLNRNHEMSICDFETAIGKFEIYSIVVIGTLEIFDRATTTGYDISVSPYWLEDLPAGAGQVKWVKAYNRFGTVCTETQIRSIWGLRRWEKVKVSTSTVKSTTILQRNIWYCVGYWYYSSKSKECSDGIISVGDILVFTMRCRLV